MLSAGLAQRLDLTYLLPAIEINELIILKWIELEVLPK